MGVNVEDLTERQGDRLDELLAEVCDLVEIDRGFIDALRDHVDEAVDIANET